MADKFPHIRAETAQIALAAVFLALVVTLSAPGGAEGGAAVSPQRPLAPEAVEVQAVNVNTADEETLMTLPGIGPVLARRIAEHRWCHGPFEDARQLLEVPGIGEATLSRLLAYITLGGKEHSVEDFSGR